MDNKTKMKDNKTAPFNVWRVLMLLAVLVVVAVIAAMALDEYGEGGIAPAYSYGYSYGYIQNFSGYEAGPSAYEVGHSGYEGHSYAGNEFSYDSYSDYGGVISYAPYDYAVGSNNDMNAHLYGPYIQGYEEYGGYAGDAPFYYYGYGQPSYMRDIHIEVDSGGGISVYPCNKVYGAVFDGDYLLITFPTTIDAEDISTMLPSGWTFTVSHGMGECLEADVSNEEVDDGGVRKIDLRPYTLVRIRHIWNDAVNASGYIGIQPFVTGIPGGFTLMPVNVNSHDLLVQQINRTDLGNPNNRVINITGNFNQTAPITIPAGRNIIIASNGTNVTTHTGGPATPFIITHTGTATAAPFNRHFILNAGSSLTLSAITLNGNAVTATGTQATTFTNRGGIQTNGGTAAQPTRLILQNRATIERSHWANSQGSGINASANSVWGGTIVTMENGSRVHNNMTTVGWGGGVHLLLGTHMDMNGGIIENNSTIRTTASGNGHSAGIHVGQNNVIGATLTMRGGEIRNNTAHAIHPGGTAAQMFRAGGAGVFVHRFCTFIMYGGQIHGNILNATRTGSGGEFLLHGAGVLTLGDTTVFTMNNGSIHNNHVLATAEGVDGLLAGGGVGMFGGTFTMNNNSQIFGNSAMYGGGVYVSTGGNQFDYGTNFIMNNGSIHNNRGDFGAGVGVSSLQPLGEMGPTMFTLNGGTISNNRNRFGPLSPAPTTPPLEGGGVWVYGTATFQATFNFRGGTLGHATSDTQGNRALRGGGLWIGNGAEFNMELGAGGSFGRVMYNVAAGTGTNENLGGGIYATNPNTEINLGVGIVEGNTALNGGGVAITNNAIFNLFGTAQINGNIAHANAGQTANGGGVFASTGSTFNLAAGHTLTNNTARANGAGAVANGGAIALDGNIFNMGNNTSLIGNRAEASNGGVANGGGLALLSGAFTLQTGRTIVNNTAAATADGTANGGGIAVLGGTFTSQVNISGNNATATGAGATANGGGAMVGGGTLTLNSGLQISGNTVTASSAGATVNGGGVMVDGGILNLLDSTSIINNTAAASNGGIANGGGLSVHSGSFTLLTGRILSGNIASATDGGTAQGGGVAVLGGSFITQVNISGGTATASGAGATVNGGGAFVSGGTFAMAPNTSITGNTATATGAGATINGGGLAMDGGTFTLINTTTITGNTSTAAGGTINGGGAAVMGGSFNMEGGNIYGNSATYGGGVHLTGLNAALIMSGGTIGHATNTALGNQAFRGAGVYVGSGATFTMQPTGGVPGPVPTNPLTVATAAAGGNVVGNRINDGLTVFSGGGGVAVISENGQQATFIMNGGVVGNNFGQSVGSGTNGGISSGSGVLVGGADAVFTMNNGIIRDNTNPSWSGAGVTVAVSATFTMNNGVIVGNESTTSGGAGITSRNNATVTINNGTIRENSSIAGGALLAYNNGYITINGGIIENNITPTLLQSGGGLAIFSGSHVIMNGGIIRNHTVTNEGGGVRLSNPPNPGFHIPGVSSFTMNGGQIYNNQGSFGGGVWVNGDTTFTMTDGTIGGTPPVLPPDGTPNPNANIAQSGGGVWVGGGARFYMIDYAPESGGTPIPGNGIIEGNHATSAGGDQGGGGVYLAGTSTTFTMRAGRIRHNTVANPLTLSGFGGGVHVANQSRFYMHGGEIYGHVNLMRGGGVYVGRALPTTQDFPALAADAPTFTMYGGIIRNNTSNWGGGVANMGHAQFNMHGGYIRSNHAIGEELTVIVGGGVVNISGHHGSASLTMTGGTVEHNTSVGGAGGMWINPANVGWVPANNTYISITGGIVRYNTANGMGTPANPVIGISYNGGGGIFFASEPRNGTTFGGPTLEIYGNRTYGDTGGGGVKINEQHVEMTDGIIRDNFASVYGGGVLTFPVNDELLSGGVPGFTMSGGSIYGNEAGYGGGVAARNSTFTMYGGTIGGIDMDIDGYGYPFNAASNRADYGGGVWVGNGSAFNLRGTAQKNIIGNEAVYDGGGVFVAWNRTTNVGGQMRVQTTAPAATNIHITHNIAGRMGGGIYSGNHEYSNPLPANRIAPPAGTAVGPQIAYNNLTISSAVTFSGNRANRRYVPPTNYAALAHIDFAGTTTSQPTNAVRINPLNNYDINFRAIGIDFEFYKTDHQIYNIPPVASALPGARFRVFRTDANPDTSITPELATDIMGLILFDPSGDPNSPWEEVEMLGSHISASSFIPLGFEMTPGFIYQLVEYVAPSGFQLPFGQWRLTLSENPANLNTVIFTSIGDGSIPAFVPNGPGLRPGSAVPWFLGNIPDFNLPLTGGFGANTVILTVAGSAILVLALVAIPLLKAKKATAKPTGGMYERTRGSRKS